MNDRIKEVRKAAGLTQAAFGEKLGLSQNFVWMVETGQRVPSDRTVRDICREFSVSEAWLRDGVGEMHEAKSREAELAELVKRLLSQRPDSFQSALITTLLRFDPDGPEWEILERIFNSVEKEKAQD